MTALEDFARLAELIKGPSDAPAPVFRIVASHAVPFGRVFKQYRSDGRLLLWVNRGEVADMPRGNPASWALSYGIPVVNA